MGLSRAEKETILRWSDDPEDHFYVFTHREKVAKRLLRAGARRRSESKIAGRVVAWDLECPREWIRWPTARRKRVLSPERAAEVAERLRRGRKGQKPPEPEGENGQEGPPERDEG